ncbi:MAG: ABC transporter ATP-binding protein [Planctomycetes bacterium]|nr:ABC transporter ATP-binding protein [Planctomycetota bacterium]
MAEPNAIEFNAVTKRFGATTAVDGLTLSVRDGEIFGFVGPNGAGKTTTIRMAATLLAPDAGTVNVLGHSASRDVQAVRKLIGYMPDFTGIHQGLLVREYLEFFAACYGIPAEKREALIGDLMALTDLASKANEPATALSRGMKQRLSLARALVHDPRILLLDEPASGLDPRARVEIRELLRELARMGKTIFVSSHILSELEELCDRIAIIEKGRLRFEGQLSDILARRGSWRIRVREDVARAIEALGAAPFIAAAEPAEGFVRIRLADGVNDPGDVAGHLAARGLHLIGLEPDILTLEDAFLALTDGEIA